MSRNHPVRTVKVCKVCGEGYDAFKSLDMRGRYCSPGCLAEARRRSREGGHVAADVSVDTGIGPAALPPRVSLGNLTTTISLELDNGLDRRLI